MGPHFKGRQNHYNHYCFKNAHFLFSQVGNQRGEKYSHLLAEEYSILICPFPKKNLNYFRLGKIVDIGYKKFHDPPYANSENRRLYQGPRTKNLLPLL